MLENEITEEDIGSWYVTRNGDAYVKITDKNPPNHRWKFNGVHVSGGAAEVWNYTEKGEFYYYNPRPDDKDIVRKLDPIEVNLLRLEKRLKDTLKGYY